MLAQALSHAVARIVARGRAAQFAMGVMLPVGIVCTTFLYSDNRTLMLLTWVDAGVVSLTLGTAFFSSYWRIRRLATNHAEMMGYRGPFALLLRSFSRTEVYQGIGRFVGPDPGAAPLHEESVAGALEIAMRLRGVRTVALGGSNMALPSDHRLFWLTSTAEDWERRIEVLMRNAGVIFVCPDVSQGVLTELRMLRDEGGLERTVFVMAPAIRSGGYISGDDDLRAKQAAWGRVGEELTPLGYRMPAYRASGSVFRIGADLAVAASADPQYDTYLASGLTSKRRRKFEALADAILSLVPGPPENWPILSDALRQFGPVHPIHEPPNYLDPPGGGRSHVHVFMQGASLSIFHHAACVILLGVGYLWA